MVADADGGAISAATVGDVTITGSTFDHNTAAHHGGALFLGTAHSVNISGSTFDSNTATDDGGAIEIASIGEDSTWTGDTFTGNSAGATNFAGGAAFLMGTVAADTAFVIDRSTFSGNSSATGATATIGAVGWVGTDNGTVQLADSTMTGNSFTGGTNGTGIDLAVLAIAANADFDVVQSTLDESAAGNGLLFTDSNSEFVRLASSTLIGPGVLQVLANSSALADSVETRDTVAISRTALPAFGLGGTPAEISYSITSDVAGPQLVDVGSTQFNVADAHLGPLVNNGGPTSTRLPLAGSPAIDTGDPSFTIPLTDQRGAGFARIVNGRVDIGAVEGVAPTLAATGVDPASTAWTASTALLTGALLVGAVLLTRRRAATRRNRQQPPVAWQACQNAAPTSDREYGFRTRAIHAGNIPDAVTGSRALPIYQTTAFVFDDTADAAARFALQKYGNIYSRLANPTVAALRGARRQPRGRASGRWPPHPGSAPSSSPSPRWPEPATTSSPARSLYGGTITQLDVTLRRFGVETTFVHSHRSGRLRRGDHRQDQADLRRDDRQPLRARSPTWRAWPPSRTPPASR